MGLWDVLKSVSKRIPLISGTDSRVTFPDPNDLTRIKLYGRFEYLYIGKHKEVYVNNDKYIYDPNRPYIYFNMLAEVTNLIADRLFGEIFTITTEDDLTDEWINMFMQQNSYKNLFTDFSKLLSYCGDGVIKLVYDANTDTIRFVPIHPSNFSLQIVNKQIEAGIFWELHKINEQTFYLLKETQYKGYITHDAYRLHKNTIDNTFTYDPDLDRISPTVIDPTLLDIQETGVNEFLWAHFAINKSSPNEFYGNSDYLHADPLQGELNNRLMQNAEILDKNAKPKMYGPMQFVKINENKNYARNPHVDFEQLEYIIVDEGETVPGYITWDGSIEQSFKEIESLKNDIIFVCGLSPESFVNDNNGRGAESGKALRLRQIRTQSKILGYQSIYDQNIKNLIATASSLAYTIYRRNVPLIEPENITIIWPDGIPDDTTEKIDQESAAISAGITSKKSAMQRVYGYTEEQANNELAQMALENNVTQSQNTQF